MPEDYGGLGLDLVDLHASRTGALAGGVLQCEVRRTYRIGTLPLVFFGTPEQKQRYLPGLASGEILSAYALTEPGGQAQMRSAARASATLSGDGQEWILNGTKQWITNSGFANLFTLYAKVDGEKFSAFLIDGNTPGLSTGAEEHKMGLKGSSTRTVQLDNVRIPRANLLGEVVVTHIIAFTILNVGLVKLAAGAVGACKHALALAAAYARERCQFGLLDH